MGLPERASIVHIRFVSDVLSKCGILPVEVHFFKGLRIKINFSSGIQPFLHILMH